VRTGAFRGADVPADHVRDTDAETLWCGELQELQARLDAAGGGIQIERALQLHGKKSMLSPRAS
jgi:hypothetical protein